MGLRFVLERHNNTLADTIDSTLRLLEMVPAPNLGVNYQVAGNEATAAALEDIRRLSGRIWNVHAQNPWSGAYGIPQAVPGTKMSSAGPNWQNSARTQVLWGLRYIKAVYGKPRFAWMHEVADGWY